MYWPIGTPRIYATSSSRAPSFNLVVSGDGLSDTPPEPDPAFSPSAHDHVDVQPGPATPVTPVTPVVPVTPATPATPLTPAVQSVEHDDNPFPGAAAASGASEPYAVPLSEPVLALRVSRAGHLFAVITATSITLWQTKVAAMLPALSSRLAELS